MKNHLVKLCVTVCLLMGVASAQAVTEERYWEETSRTGMEAFVTAVKNAGYIDNGGNILLSGIGYAAKHAIGFELANKIVPEEYLEYDAFGRLVFIYNGLYNADGSVRESITVDEFTVIGQGVGWFVPVDAGVFNRMVLLDKTLIELNRRAQAGQAVSSEIDNVTKFLQGLTGRSIAGQVNPNQVNHMNNRIHRVEDGQWTLAMRKATQKEALAATAPAFDRLKDVDVTLLKQNAELKAELQATKEALSRQQLLAETNARAVAQNGAQVGDNAVRLSALEKTVQAVDGKVGLLEQTGETNQSRMLIGGVIVGIVLIVLFAWLLVLSRKREQAALKHSEPHLTSVGDKVKGSDEQDDKQTKSFSAQDTFDPRDFLKDMRSEKTPVSSGQEQAA